MPAQTNHYLPIDPVAVTLYIQEVTINNVTYSGNWGDLTGNHPNLFDTLECDVTNIPTATFNFSPSDSVQVKYTINGGSVITEDAIPFDPPNPPERPA